MRVGDADVAAAVWTHSKSGVLAVDERGALVLLNAAGRRILGGRAASARLGEELGNALADHPALIRLLREALAGRAPLGRAELELPRGGAAPLLLGFSLVPIPRDGAGRQGVALIFRDLAPIERADERARLQQRLAALGEMAAGLAHELRNPLACMEVAAGLLARRLDGDPESRELVSDLRGQLRRLADTVSASLDFVRPLSLRREPLDAWEVLEEALALALARVPAPEQVERRSAAPLPKLEADRQLLCVALVNLIANACQAMAERPRPASRLELAIAAAPAEAPPELWISIGDNGPGIPAEHRDRIFDPFFTTRAGGSGIGLATVQKIAVAHAGSLSLETGPAGSVFRLHLPLDTAAP